MMDELNKKKIEDDQYSEMEEKSSKRKSISENIDESLQDPVANGIEDGNKKIKLDSFEANFEGKNVICKVARYKKLFLKFIYFRYLFSLNPIDFSRKDYKNGSDSPKSILHAYALENSIPKPKYHTFERKPERVYKSWVELSGVYYTTPNWYKILFIVLVITKFS